jgi:hypothetical protein
MNDKEILEKYCGYHPADGNDRFILALRKSRQDERSKLKDIEVYPNLMDEVKKLRNENAELRKQVKEHKHDAEIYCPSCKKVDTCSEIAALKTENAELLLKLSEMGIALIEKVKECKAWKSRWEKLKEGLKEKQRRVFKDSHNSWYNMILEMMQELESGDPGFHSKTDSDNAINTKSHYKDITIESGGESSDGKGKTGDIKVGSLNGSTSSEQPKPEFVEEDIKGKTWQFKPNLLTLCKSCGCMTKTIHDEEITERCGKCGKEKSGGSVAKREPQFKIKISANDFPDIESGGESADGKGKTGDIKVGSLNGSTSSEQPKPDSKKGAGR